MQGSSWVKHWDWSTGQAEEAALRTSKELHPIEFKGHLFPFFDEVTGTERF